MIQNKVPGFCTDETLDVMDLKADDAILKSDRTKIRSILKNRIVENQKQQVDMSGPPDFSLIH